MKKSAAVLILQCFYGCFVSINAIMLRKFPGGGIMFDNRKCEKEGSEMYSPLVPQRPLTVTALYTVHYFEYSGSYVFPGESHDFWEFLYVDKGILRVLAGDHSCDLSRGQIVFHEPGEFHALSAVGVLPDLVVVSFACRDASMDAFRGLVTTVGVEERALLARIVEESAAAFSTPLNLPQTTALERREDARLGAEQLICAALEEFLLRLLRRRERHDPSRMSAGFRDETAARVSAYLEQHIDSPLTLEDVCRGVLVGRSRLQKIFHAETGGGVMEYFSSLKIRAARRMIREGRLNFTQIAARLGYQSVHYFSRRFHLATGMTPSEYARSVKMLAELPGAPSDTAADDNTHNG